MFVNNSASGSLNITEHNLKVISGSIVCSWLTWFVNIVSLENCGKVIQFSLKLFWLHCGIKYNNSSAIVGIAVSAISSNSLISQAGPGIITKRSSSLLTRVLTLSGTRKPQLSSESWDVSSLQKLPSIGYESTVGGGKLNSGGISIFSGQLASESSEGNCCSVETPQANKPVFICFGLVLKPFRSFDALQTQIENY